MKKSLTKTLSAPLRVYWDLAAGPDAASAALALKLAKELSDLRVFFVILRPESQRDDIGEIMGLLKGGGVRVTLSISDADSLPVPDVLAHADTVDFRPADAGNLKGLLEKAKNNVPAGKPLTVSVIPSKDNYGVVLGIISYALDLGLRTFNLTNPCLVYDRGRACEFIIGAAERDILSRGIEGLLSPFGQGVKLLLHDLFLHKSLKLPGLAGRIEYAGCQAGDAIAYIDRSFAVYPCATMPLPVGSLHETTLKDIWASEGRRLLRERVERLPGQCLICPEAAECKGGCRGLAWEVGGEECVDPGCGKYTGMV